MLLPRQGNVRACSAKPLINREKAGKNEGLTVELVNFALA
jgi:hypothetical protein